ncbi:MAG TPA: hypothetical protein EYQ00_14205, partial [Dehalococcoidia bacterium]|nr:hypothetical protein [Dehalococcoidia bacterium]
MKTLLLPALLVLCISTQSFCQSDKKVLIIGIDGCRADALELAQTPNIDGLIANGIYSPNALNEDITISGPGWSARVDDRVGRRQRHDAGLSPGPEEEAVKFALVHRRFGLDGGTERFLEGLTRGLHERGHEIDASIRSGNEQDFADSQMIAIILGRLSAHEIPAIVFRPIDARSDQPTIGSSQAADAHALSDLEFHQD